MMTFTISTWLFVVLMCIWIISAILSAFEKIMKIRNQKYARKQLEIVAEELKQQKAKFNPVINLSVDTKETADEIGEALSALKVSEFNQQKGSHF